MKTLIPPPLQPGDMIGVMAPSSYVEKDDVEKSKALLESRGYKVFIHPQTWERHHQSAGNHLQKTLALQGLWQRDDIKAVWAAGGGNRALHLLESINFEAMKKKPKIFIGFSDVTALLNAVHVHTGLVTYHGPVFKNLHKYDRLDHLLSLIGGGDGDTAVPLAEAEILREGRAEGKLIGGNLSLFQYLPRTLPGDFWDGAILFLEDCGEELSHIDRMFMQLRRLGVLQTIGGLICGSFSDVKDSGRPFGFTLQDIFAEHTEDLDVPVVYNAPFGHTGPFYTFPLGRIAQLDTKKKRLSFL